MSEPMGSGPLAGIRVIELGVWVAGPAAGGIMSDWGADVIKIEPESGDPQRKMFASVGVRADIPVPPFEVDNRGKRSVILDLRQSEDLERLHGLLADADVFVSNMRGAALDRLGLGHEEVCARHRHLVYGLITGYGIDGPEADRAGYDVGAFWARSGAAHTIVPTGQLPPGLLSGFGDHQTGMSMAAGIMAKLVERGRTGNGGFVTTSLLRNGMYGNSWDTAIHLRFQKRAPTPTRDANPSPLINSYMGADQVGFWLICLEADRHWPKLLAAIDRPDIGMDERYGSARGRLEHCVELIAELDAHFATAPAAHWTDRFDEHDVWWAPIQSIEQLLEDPQAQAGIVDMDARPGERTPRFRSVATPVDFGGHELQLGVVPHLGEHTDEVLGSADFN
ncbi:MAG: CaiB/BaiF CoA transferase family protein [Ilumatobacter sp.]